MANDETVRRFCNACEQGDTKSLDQILADGYVFDHANHEGTNDKKEFIQMVGDMKKAFPDLQFQVRDIQGSDPAKAQVRLSGTHKGPLDLSTVGGGVIDPTGKKFSLPWETCHWSIESGKVDRHWVDKSDGGGLPGMMRQLGVEVPAQH